VGPKWVCIFVNVNSKTWRSSKYILYFMYSIGVKRIWSYFSSTFFWGLKFASYLLEQVLAYDKNNVIWSFFFFWFQILWHLCLVCSQVQFKSWSSWRFFLIFIFISNFVTFYVWIVAKIQFRSWLSQSHMQLLKMDHQTKSHVWCRFFSP
jgi:hypothetical protein